MRGLYEPSLFNAKLPWLAELPAASCATLFLGAERHGRGAQRHSRCLSVAGTFMYRTRGRLSWDDLVCDGLSLLGAWMCRLLRLP